MQRIFITAVFSLACLLCACAESNEKSASRSYVKAAQKVSAAQAAFDSADYTTALELCNQARADVEKIILKRPLRSKLSQTAQPALALARTPS